jgi:type IV secretory pathway TraG/TraD family ATPase VirD4
MNVIGIRQAAGFGGDQPYVLFPHDRARHVHVVGQTGTGKSVLFENMLAEDLAAGDGVGLFDPHGDLGRKAVSLIPLSRAHQLVYLDPSDLDRPIGFNVLDNVPERRKPTVADDIVSSFVHIFGDSSVGARSQQVLRNALRALMDAQDTTLLCVPKLLTNDDYRERIIRTIKDPFVRSYWVDQFNRYDTRKRDDVISPILNKLDAFLSSPAIRNIVGQPRSTFDLRRTMDEGRILIVTLSKGAIGEGNAHFLGALLISRIAQAALSRGDIPENKRRPFHLYVDEFQSVATGSFALILSEARKYALTLTLGHQHLAQVPHALIQSVLGNTGSVVALRVGADDAPLLASHIGLKNPDALKDLPNFRAWGRFLQNGTPSSPIFLATRPPPAPVHDRAGHLIANSRVRFGRDKVQLELRLRKFLRPASSRTRRRKANTEWKP